MTTTHETADPQPESATPPYQVCFECSAEYATAAGLLDAHNRVLAADGLSPESDVTRVRCCPACAHDFLHLPTVVADTDTSAAVPVVALDATKSSHNWAEMPGNWDRLNLRAVFASDNRWGIPTLPPASWVPARLVAYNDRAGIDRWAHDPWADVDPHTAVHFFLDDYRFETLWTKPERGLSRCQRIGAALTPDFSLWTTMPVSVQLWQVYRSRWCGAWLLHHGVHVVPTVSWSTPDSYQFAFAGLPARSVVAVSTVGITRADLDTRARFVDGYAAMLHHLDPTTVLVYGRALPDAAAALTPADTEVRYYPTRWATHETQRAHHRAASRTEQARGVAGGR